ncbi:MAG: hypothetical protein J7647_00620 [Cyanobacteria bacterium SBLK]|nr:hypothetical protein [Cyanobacteria bacterium SBLK]
MKVIAVKKGNFLELHEALDIPDGQTVTIEIAEIPERSPISSSDPVPMRFSEGDRVARLMDFLGVRKEGEEFEGDFAELDGDR